MAVPAVNQRKVVGMPNENDIIQLFSKRDFDVDSYIKNVVATGKIDHSQLIHHCAERTSSEMKQSIYENYGVFIEAGENVHGLQTQMNEMHVQINDLKRMLESIIDINLISDDPNITTPENIELRQKPPANARLQSGNLNQIESVPITNETSLASLLEKVEGCSGVVSVSGRKLLFEGTMKELNTETFAVVSRVKTFLFNDSLLICTKLTHRRGPVEYKYQVLYELDNLAVVNVRERPGQNSPPNAFQLLYFPDTRLFQVETSKQKTDWMDALESAKKHKAILNSHRRDSALVNRPNSSYSLKLFENDTNPFNGFGDNMRKSIEMEQKMKSSHSSASTMKEDNSHKNVMEQSYLLANPFAGEEDSLLETPEDLDVCIAERNFTGAVELVERARSRLHQLDMNHSQWREFSSRVEQRVEQLVQALQRELITGANRHGGVRSVRTAVQLLVRLQRSSIACELFFTYRSAVMQRRLQEVRQEGSQKVFAIKLSLMFHRNILEAYNEYNALFTRNQQFLGRLCAWCSEEAVKFSALLGEVLIEGRSVHFYEISIAIQKMHVHAQQVSEYIGFDLRQHIDRGMRDALEEAAKDQSKILCDAIDQRANEEKWKRLRFNSSKEAKRFLEECDEFGVPEIRREMASDTSLRLTNNTCQFAKNIVLFAISLRQIDYSELNFIFGELVAAVLKSELKHYERYLTSKKFLEKRNFIQENLRFIYEQVLPKMKAICDFSLCEKYQETVADGERILNSAAGIFV